MDRPRPVAGCRSTAGSWRKRPGVPLPDNYPVVGKDAFRTGTGVHAAAIIKARARGEEWLADLVYSVGAGEPDRQPPDHRGGSDERRVERGLLAAGAGHRDASASWCARSSSAPRSR